MGERKVGKATVRVIKGDITELDIDAFVFYARPDLKLGTGYGAAIAVRGGRSIQQELDGVGGLGVTGAVATSGGNLKARLIIHAVGPRFQEEDTEGKLRRTVKACLALAEEKGVRRIAFPAMGAGFYGVPLDVSCRILFDAAEEHLGNGSGIEELVFCLNDLRELKPFQARLDSLQG